eukprot:TRINITY_DN11281_c0_g1_i3.p1 TRINITY_DN11281_c0_g1~~TRINITY_DN11281_c0_g1_i3.p1  ORF type:complete len:298 (-),score=45.53 TRINITY_DN11281_c0_g1_i3:629-1522(-)
MGKLLMRNLRAQKLDKVLQGTWDLFASRKGRARTTPRWRPRSNSKTKHSTAVMSNCQLGSMPGVNGMLTFGCLRKPSNIVVLLHGLNDSSKDCSKGVVARWAKCLPDALLVVPQSPHKTWFSTEAAPGYDWVDTRREAPWVLFEKLGPRSSQYKASIREYQRSLMASCRDVSYWLDALLEKHTLSDKNVILAGFSIGSIIAAVVGAWRNSRGVIVCGGLPCVRELRLKGLMPRWSSTRFCAVNGTRDDLVERSLLEALLRRYETKWHWSSGVGHDFPQEWYAQALAWMQSEFGNAQK